MIVRAIGVALLALTVPPTVVHAQSPAALDEDICVVHIGSSFMQFSAYQLRDPRARFCTEIPDVGPATIVIDQPDAELRNMTTDVRIIKLVDGGNSPSEMPGLLSNAAVLPELLDPITEKRILPKPYPTGIIEIKHTFTSPGQYHAMVTVKNDHGQVYVSEFPFSVGNTKNNVLIFSGLAAALLAGALLFFYKNARRIGLWQKARNM